MNEFLNAVKETVNKFKSLNITTIKLISHLDCDGLSSSSIMIKAFKREGYKFSLSTVRQLDDFVLEEVKREKRAIVLMDTPYRLEKLLGELSVVCPSRKSVIGLELTKPEEVIILREKQS